GQVIGSSQLYASEATCKNGIESVKKNGPTTVIEDETDEKGS
ncbi:MAG: YegP family protein, partial [Parabacteroides sp.]|nr:YegP family protein [Parabacteroides sp.]